MHEDELARNSKINKLELTDNDVDYAEELEKAAFQVDHAKERKIVLKKLQSKRPADRWRPAVEWLMKSNKYAKDEHEAILESIKETQAELYNRTASGDYVRHGLRIPQIVLDTIFMVDPDSSLIFEKGTIQEKRELLHHLMRVFPEYTIPIDM